MKIAIILRKLNVKGGVQRHVIEFARVLQSRGHDVTLYSFYYSPRDCYENLLQNLRVIALDRIPRGKILSGLSGEFAVAKELAMRIDLDTELLNPHDHGAYRVAYYFKKYKRNIPSVWMMHDMPTKMFSYMRERRLDPHFSRPLLKILFYRLFDWYDLHFIKAQDVITVLDKRDQEWVKKYFGKKATIVRNGISLELFTFVKHLLQPQAPIRLLVVGIFLRHRRFEDAIKALAILRKRGRNVTLTIIGDDRADVLYAKEIRVCIANAHVVDSVFFHGRVTEEELTQAYQSHTIFLFPNDWQSWGLAVFEAMASGCPVIVSTTAGASEVLTDGENALLVPPKNSEAMANAIERLLKDHALYESLSKQGRIFVEQNISWERYAKGMLKVFEDVSLGKIPRNLP